MPFLTVLSQSIMYVIIAIIPLALIPFIFMMERQKITRLIWSSVGGPREEIRRTETHVQEIVDLLQDSKLSQVEIGERFGVTASVISTINCGKTWKHIPRRVPVRSRYITRPGKTTILNEETVKQIGDLLTSGINQQEIATQYGISQSYVSAIKMGKIRAYHHIVEPSPHDDRYKLAEHDVLRIIKLLSLGGTTQVRIAQRFGVQPGTIAAIKSGAIWNHLARPQEWPKDPRRKLDEAQVLEIISMIAVKVPRKKIVKQFNISIWTVRDIRRGERWKHLPRPWLS
jgi:predicted XRE-type DNA-binding protein